MYSILSKGRRSCTAKTLPMMGNCGVQSLVTHLKQYSLPREAAGQNRELGLNDVITNFNRFEFQQRGTFSLYVLVWKIREEALEVVYLQASDRSSLPLYPWLSRVIPTATGQVLIFQHW